MEENSNPQTTQDLLKNAARFGAIIGGVGVVLTFLLYAIDYTLLADWKVGLLILAVYIGLVIYGGISYRNEVGGFLPYGKAFQHGYVVLIVGGFIGTIFSIILYTVIDPELPQKLADVTVENTAAMLQKFGTPEDQVEKTLDGMKEDMPKRFGMLGLVKQFGWGLLVNAVISVITALIVRKNEPEGM